MGSGSSKPEQQVFSPDAPVSFSQSVLDSLQQNPETDSVRARTNELHSQTRVTEELTRIRDAQTQQLNKLTASLTTDPTDSDDIPTTPLEDPTHNPTSLFYHLSSPFYQDHTPGTVPAASKPTFVDSGRSHASVAKEVMDLRKKLEARKMADKSSPEVEKAKESVVQCLRANDRRPLDCWKEVEEFKREVGKLEQEFVRKVGR